MPQTNKPIQIVRPFQVVEQFTISKKGDEDTNEDAIFVGKNLAAVIDGTSLAAGEDFDGMTGGRFMAQTLVRAFGEVDNKIDITAEDLFSFLTKKAREALEKKGRLEKTFAAASVIVFSRHRNQIWRVGDCSFMVDGKAYHKKFLVAEVRSKIRQYLLCQLEQDGLTEQQLLDNDPTPRMVTDLVKKQETSALRLIQSLVWQKQGTGLDFKKVVEHLAGIKSLANDPTCSLFGYGVVNGQNIPSDYIEVVPLPDDTRKVVLASDGYPRVLRKLREAEAYLDVMNRKDPLGYGDNLQPKGKTKGLQHYDDRTFLSLIL